MSVGSVADPSGPPRQPRRGGRSEFRGRLCSLRPLLPEDELALYRAALEPGVSHRWRYRGRNVSPEEFHQSLHQGVLSQFVLEGSSGSLCGHVLAYDYEPDAGHAYVAIQALEGVRPGLALEGLALFVRYLFSRFDLRKLYFDIPEYNRSLAEGLDVLRLEAVHRQHFAFDGGYVDRFIYALYRADVVEYLNDLPTEVRASIGI